jgi:hypothetical protein
MYLIWVFPFIPIARLEKDECHGGPSLPVSLLGSAQWNEAHGQQVPHLALASRALGDDAQGLHVPRLTHRDDHLPALFELLEQWPGNFRRPARHDHGVERLFVRPAKVAVARLDLHVAVSQARQSFLGRLCEFREQLNGVDLTDQLGQDSRLVAAICLLLVNYQMMKKNGVSATSPRQSMLKSDS